MVVVTPTYSPSYLRVLFFFFFNDTATTEIYTLSLHDALPISELALGAPPGGGPSCCAEEVRSEEHTSELQSLRHLVCRLLLEKKNKQNYYLLARPSQRSPPTHPATARTA